MSKRLYILLILLSFSGILLAKDNYQKGKIILKSGDTIDCVINVFQPYILISSNKVKYKVGEEMKKILTSEIKVVILDTLRYEHISYTYTKTVPRGPKEVRVTQTDKSLSAVIVSGKSELMKKYYIQKQGAASFNGSSSALSSSLQWSYFIKVEDTFKMINWVSFKKDCEAVYSYCPGILEKIKTNNYKYKNIEDLVILANDICTSDQNKSQP